MTRSIQPQASWSPRTENVHSCDFTICQSENCARVNHIPCDPCSLTWLLKMLCQNPAGSWAHGFFGAWATHLFSWPCNKPFSALNSHVGLFGLTVHQAHELRLTTSVSKIPSCVYLINSTPESNMAAWVLHGHFRGKRTWISTYTICLLKQSQRGGGLGCK